MYRAIWRRLPGTAPVRVLIAVVLVAAVVAALFAWGFPAADAVLFPTGEVVTSAG